MNTSKRKSNTPCRSIVICGAYGADNLGDETLLKVIIAQLRSINHDLDICVITRKPEETAIERGVNAVHTFDFAAITRALRCADMLLFGGGSLIQNVTSRRSLYYYLGTARLAKKLGCTVMMYGCGIGPLSHAFDRKQTARVLNSCVDAITLRDEKSALLLAELGVTKPEIALAADPVLSLYGCGDEEADRFMSDNGLNSDEKICFALRPWQMQSDRLDALSAAVKYAYSELKLTPVFMTLNPEFDTAIAEKVAEAAGVPYVILPAIKDAQLAIGVMKKMRLVVSMRLHAILFAASVGASTVGISYDPKVSGFMEYTGCGSCIDLCDLNADALIDCMRKELERSSADERTARMEKIKAAESANLRVAAGYINAERISYDG